MHVRRSIAAATAAAVAALGLTATAVTTSDHDAGVGHKPTTAAAASFDRAVAGPGPFTPTITTVAATTTAATTTATATSVPGAGAAGVPCQEPVTGVHATVDAANSQVHLTWTAAPGATSYRVWELTHTKSRPVGIVTGTSRVSSVLPAGRYTYSVQAVGPLGTSGTVASTPTVSVIGGGSTPAPTTTPTAAPTGTSTATATGSPTVSATPTGTPTVTGTAGSPTPTGTSTATPTAADTTTAPTRGPPTTTSGGSGYSHTKPALTNPRRYTIPAAGGKISVPAGRDAYITGGSWTGSLTIEGGRNVVVEGGACLVVGHGCGRIQNHTGTVWVEGQVLGTDACTTTEGWDVAEPHAKAVVFVNIKANCLNGSRSTNHSDIFQDWAGAPGQVVVLERVYAPAVRYQGLMWQPQQFGSPVARLYLLHLVLAHEPGHGGYLLFLTGPSPITASDVNLTGPSTVFRKGGVPGVKTVATPPPSPLLPGAGGTTVGAGYLSQAPAVAR